jgi:hypothetical protein
MPVREARPREPKTATVERREASVPRHGTQGASQAPGVSRHDTPQGCSAEHPNVSRRSAHPSVRGERSKVANPGRRNAPRERDVLFDIVRRSAGAVAAHFGETNPTNPTGVVSAHSASKTRVNALMLGTHNHGLWLWVPALRPLHGRRPGRRPFTKNEKPTCGCGNRSPAPFHCFRPVINNGECNSSE